MANFAELDNNNKVLRVMAVNDFACKDETGNESEEVGKQLCQKLFGGNWIQTSFSGTFRGRLACVNGYYIPEDDKFTGVKHYETWVLNKDNNYEWEPPTPYPDDGKTYQWDDDTSSWSEV